MYPGVTHKIGDEEVVIPALSLGMLRNGVLAQIREHDKLLADGLPYEAFDLRGKIIFKALQRNYPDFDETKFLDSIGLDVMNTLWLAVLGMSGFQPGEVKAAAETGPSTDGT